MKTIIIYFTATSSIVLIITLLVLFRDKNKPTQDESITKENTNLTSKASGSEDKTEPLYKLYKEMAFHYFIPYEHWVYPTEGKGIATSQSGVPSWIDPEMKVFSIKASYDQSKRILSITTYMNDEFLAMMDYRDLTYTETKNEIDFYNCEIVTGKRGSLQVYSNCGGLAINIKYLTGNHYHYKIEKGKNLRERVYNYGNCKSEYKELKDYRFQQ